MSSKIYWFRNGFYVVWYTSIYTVLFFVFHVLGLNKCVRPKGTHPKKKASFFRAMSKGGGGSTGIQKFWGSFSFPYFDQLLDIKWGGGLTMFQKFWGPFCLNIGNFGPLKSYLTVVQNGPIKKLPHNVQNEGGRGVEPTFGQCPKERPFFLMASLRSPGQPSPNKETPGQKTVCQSSPWT